MDAGDKANKAFRFRKNNRARANKINTPLVVFPHGYLATRRFKSRSAIEPSRITFSSRCMHQPCLRSRQTASLSLRNRISLPRCSPPPPSMHVGRHLGVCRFTSQDCFEAYTCPTGREKVRRSRALHDRSCSLLFVPDCFPSLNVDVMRLLKRGVCCAQRGWKAGILSCVTEPHTYSHLLTFLLQDASANRTHRVTFYHRLSSCQTNCPSAKSSALVPNVNEPYRVRLVAPSRGRVVLITRTVILSHAAIWTRAPCNIQYTKALASRPNLSSPLPRSP